MKAMNIDEAIKFLSEVYGLTISENTDKWMITDDNEKDFNFSFKDDECIIRYAEELKLQEIGDDETEEELQ